LISPWPALLLLLLIGAANTAPLFAKKWLGERAAWPLDGDARWFDGQPVFGRSKTVRGLVIGVCVPALLAILMEHPAWQGAVVGFSAMVGDLFSSFCKRRMRLPPSSQAWGLDQIPEVLLPAWVARAWFGLSALDVAMIVVVFFALEVVLSKLLYRMKLRDRPY
jgi:hypothetical protein